jgi:DNA polymerase V
MEIYSIDEAFLTLSEEKDNSYLDIGKSIRKKLLMCTGIPTSIGIAPTKTLAKLAAAQAKKGNGFFLLKDKKQIDLLLKKTPTVEIWGIGKNTSNRLKKLNIFSAYDLCSKEENYLKKYLSITALKVALELKGVDCSSSNDLPSPNKSIICSKTFSVPLTSLKKLEEAISSFIATAAQKLEEQNSLASFLITFIQTSRFKQPYYENSCHNHLAIPTFFPPILISHAKNSLKKIYRPNLKYKKAGIILTDFVSKDYIQQDLFIKKNNNKKEEELVNTIKKINYRYNKRSIFFAAEGIEQNWKKNNSKRSNHYTTCWEDIPTAK